jgi:hypothetical protein
MNVTSSDPLEGSERMTSGGSRRSLQKANAMSLIPSKAPLSAATLARLREVRPLSDYKLHFKNPQYPLLSLIYAVFAGGEHTLYCDFTPEFVGAYLGESHRPETAAKVYKIIKVLDDERNVEREKPPAAQKQILMNAEQVEGLLHLLKEELLQKDPPAPMW